MSVLRSDLAVVPMGSKHDVVDGAQRGRAQQVFDFGEGLLDGVEVRRLGGQQDQAASGGFDHLASPRTRLDGEIVQHTDGVDSFRYEVFYQACSDETATASY